MSDTKIKAKQQKVTVRGFDQTEIQDAHLAVKLYDDPDAPNVEAMMRNYFRLYLRIARADFPEVFKRRGGGNPIFRSVLASLKLGSGTVDEIKRRTGIGENALRTALRRLEEMGKIERLRNGRKAGPNGGRRETIWNLK